jgi:hypothetical protein
MIQGMRRVVNTATATSVTLFLAFPSFDFVQDSSIFSTTKRLRQGGNSCPK